jgi:cytoskeleton protein RodZ
VRARVLRFYGSLSNVNAEHLDTTGQGRAPIGALLEQKRQEKGLSLRDVEQATKIRTRYLEGLEREDYSVLPDAVYVQGFLKTYANFLGLDGERLSRELKDRRSPRRERQLGHEGLRTTEFEQPLINPGGLHGAERRMISGATVLAVALAVLVLTAVIGALYLVGSWSSGGPGAEGEPEVAQQEDVPADREPAPSPAQLATTEPTGGEPTTGADAVRVTVWVTGSPTGLSILTDGTLAYDQVAQPGFSRTLEARDAITISTANAGAVSVEANGQDVGVLGNSGQPLTRTFTRSPEG